MSVHVQSQYSNPIVSNGSVEVRRISNTEWRVSDADIPVGDAGRVLGFVERINEGRYDVLQLGHGHGIDRLSFGSLREVVDYFARR